MIFKHDNIKLTGEPAVDTLNVTIYCDENDTITVGNNAIPFMKLAHDGGLQNATLSLRRGYIERDGQVPLYVSLFEGRVEVASAGGLAVKLRVKSLAQGLASPVPVRMFVRQNAYTTNNGVVTTLASDTNNMVIPLKPSGNVLVRNG